MVLVSLKVGLGGIKNQRYALLDSVVEFVFQKPVGFFSIGGTDFRQLAHFWIVIDVEMVGLQHMPIELLY